MKEHKGLKKVKEDSVSTKLEKLKPLQKDAICITSKETITKLGSVTSAKNIFANTTTKYSFQERLKKKENPVKIVEINLNIQSNFKVSQSEIGLASFFKNNRDLFLSRVMKGPPEYFRWVSWTIICQLDSQRTIDHYEKCLNKDIDSKTNIQILKDIHRTFVIDDNFNSEKAELALYNVLKAYAACDTEVSYCQGMNFIAGFLLIVSHFNEVDTFYLMEKIFNTNFGQDKTTVRGLYTQEFPMLKLYVYQFNKLFQQRLPVVYLHFKELDVPSELWISKWIQTLFTMSLPWFLLIRVWDCLLVRGVRFIFSFSLAILRIFEKELLLFKDVSDVSEFFKKLNPYKVLKENDKNLYNFENILEEAMHIHIEKSFFEATEKEFHSKEEKEKKIEEIKIKEEKDHKTVSLEIERSKSNNNTELSKGMSHKSTIEHHIANIHSSHSEDSGNSVSSEHDDGIMNNVKSHTLKIKAKLSKDIKIGIRRIGVKK